MTVVEDPVVIEGHILSMANIATVSFQRYPEEMLRGPSEVPRSHGALPIELTSPVHGFVPTRQGEGVWLGLSPQSGKPSMQVDWLGTQTRRRPAPMDRHSVEPSASSRTADA